MQLDIFNDNPSVTLRNDVILALQRCDGRVAQQAWETLGKQHPDDDGLAALLLLIVALAERTSAPFQTHADLRSARLALQDKTTPAALHSMGATEGVPWLRQRWQELVERAAPLPYRAEHLDEHAAPLWLAAQRWQAAMDAVSKIESWRRIPAPLSWMLQARLRLQGLQANWGLLAELAWLPAWVLTERPALAPALTQAQASQHTRPEQAMRVMVELLGLEHQGRQHEVIERRKTLRGLHGSLYAAYMATR